MKKTFKKKVIVLLLLILGVLLLALYFFLNQASNQVPEDFWNRTAQALDYKNYESGKWDISVEENVKDHPKIFIQNIEENATVSYSFSENGISYIYDLQSTEDDYTINNEKMTITSTDSDYKKYSVDYMNVIYHGPLYFDTITASGNITVQNDGSVIFDDTPFLKEMMERERTLIQEFEEKFDLDYSKTDFVNLPELFKDVQFDENTNYSESLNAIQYFSNADINAKGYQIQTFLELDKNGNTGILGTYVAEQKMYGSQVNVTLQPRSIENCYDLIPVYDYDAEYTAYISENMIYLYPIDITDEALNQEIQNNCPNSVNQLSSDIKPIEMW
ncbi:hypothetical protein [Faecalitalea cylindroides]|uniref:hypothetical protein n=1 Tax=Faecalitalea cylindroides TaxID=39483 RepID=UPI0039F50265